MRLTLLILGFTVVLNLQQGFAQTAKSSDPGNSSPATAKPVVTRQMANDDDAQRAQTEREIRRTQERVARANRLNGRWYAANETFFVEGQGILRWDDRVVIRTNEGRWLTIKVADLGPRENAMANTMNSDREITHNMAGLMEKYKDDEIVSALLLVLADQTKELSDRKRTAESPKN